MSAQSTKVHEVHLVNGCFSKILLQEKDGSCSCAFSPFCTNRTLGVHVGLLIHDGASRLVIWEKITVPINESHRQLFLVGDQIPNIPGRAMCEVPKGLFVSKFSWN